MPCMPEKKKTMKQDWRTHKCDMKTHHLPVKKTTQGKIGLQTPDVCECGKVYVRLAGV